MNDAFLGIFFGTFLLEDAALALALSMVTVGKISFFWAFLAAFSGIALGDLGLYFLGFLFARYGFWQNTSFVKKIKNQVKALDFLVVVSRVVPGSRLPIYFGAGYLGFSFLRFFLLTFFSVLLWVTFALIGGRVILEIFHEHFLLALLCFFLFLFSLKKLVFLLSDPWERRAFPHIWRKWASFEFWPAWFFYPPVVAYYAWLSFRYCTPVLPLYSNPGIPHGGLIGESKWDFLQFLENDSSSVKTFFLPEGELGGKKVYSLLAEGEISFPFVLKPDVGQRGFAVRLIANLVELNHYLAVADFPILAQEFCSWEREAGVFYYRFPDENKGKIFSITDKAFPSLVGDGTATLGELILRDKRARILASTYFSRLRADLNHIPQNGERIPIAKFGNHCQGAIFLNGQKLISTALCDAIEESAKKIPDFYVGRFDLRYSSEEELMAGKNFKILEVNGAGSEATHIWDPQTRLLEAYHVLFEQWRILFKIGQQVKEKNMVKFPLNLRKLLVDWFRFRNKNSALSVSS
jgi:membrane protein DedA with SNARE-associated domain